MTEAKMIMEKAAYNIRFGNMAGRRIYAQLFVLYSASVPARRIRPVKRINNELLFINLAAVPVRRFFKYRHIAKPLTVVCHISDALQS